MVDTTQSNASASSGKPVLNKSFERVGDMRRIYVRVDESTLQQLRFFASRKNMSLNDYFLDCISRRIEQENGLVVNTSIHTKLLESIIDEIKSLEVRMMNLENITTDSLGSIVSLTRGDEYLSDDPLVDHRLGRIPFEAARSGTADGNVFMSQNTDDDEDDDK